MPRRSDIDYGCGCGPLVVSLFLALLGYKVFSRQLWDDERHLLYTLSLIGIGLSVWVFISVYKARKSYASDKRLGRRIESLCPRSPAKSEIDLGHGILLRFERNEDKDAYTVTEDGATALRISYVRWEYETQYGDERTVTQLHPLPEGGYEVYKTWPSWSEKKSIGQWQVAERLAKGNWETVLWRLAPAGAPQATEKPHEPSDAALLERAVSLATEAMHTVALQRRRVRSSEPEDEVFVLRYWADLQFLIVALRRLRRAAGMSRFPLKVDGEVGCSLTQ